MAVTIERFNNTRIFVDKEVRDEITEDANNIIENKLEDRDNINSIIHNIDEKIRLYNHELLTAMAKYKLDKKTCKHVMKEKIRAAKNEYKKTKKDAKRFYTTQLEQYYKPVDIIETNIQNSKDEREINNKKLNQIRKEIDELQQYKLYIDMKYTSDKNEVIDKKLMPDILRKK